MVAKNHSGGPLEALVVLRFIKWKTIIFFWVLHCTLSIPTIVEGAAPGDYTVPSFSKEKVRYLGRSRAFFTSL